MPPTSELVRSELVRPAVATLAIQRGWPVNQTGWPAGNVRAEADPAIGPGLRGRVQLLAGAGELPGRRDGVCRREEPSSYEAGLRAHGSNQRFHRLLGHAVARALNTAPRLTGLGPAAPEILILQGWRRKGAARDAVAQRSRWSTSATGGGCGVGDGCVLVGGVTTGGAVSGPRSGDLVTVELGEVVGCHQ